MGKLTSFFDITKEGSPSRDISAILSDSTFSFGVWDTRSYVHKAGYISEWDLSDLTSFFEENKGIRVKMLLLTTPYMLVEQNDIGNNELSNFFSHIDPLYTSKLSFGKSVVDIQDQKFIHGINKDVLEILNTYGVSYDAFIPNAYKELTKHQNNSILMHVEENNLTLIADHDGQQMINSYTCRTHEDYLYYAELFRQQLGIDKKDAAVFFTGRISKNGAIIRLLKQYYYKVEPWMIMKAISSNAEVDATLFQDLYLAKKCG